MIIKHNRLTIMLAIPLRSRPNPSRKKCHLAKRTEVN